MAHHDPAPAPVSKVPKSPFNDPTPVYAAPDGTYITDEQRGRIDAAQQTHENLPQTDPRYPAEAACPR
jgi:hypothetical protein